MPGNFSTVVFINHWAANIGGAELSLLDIMEFASPRCRAHLITSESGWLSDKATELGVECHIIECTLKPGGGERKKLLRCAARSWPDCISFVKYVISVRSLVKLLQPVCIHANVPKSHITLFLLAILGYKGKCCFHLREIFPRRSFPCFLYRFLFPYKRGFIIAISEAVKNNLPGSLRKKTHVIYNGIHVPENQITHVERKDAVKFLYLGRIVPWKGCLELVDIFAEVKKKFTGPNATLTLIGDTIYWSLAYRKKVLERINNCGLEQSCFLLNGTDKPYEIFSDYNVFCSAAFEEPFGRAVAEAQAASMPVVVYDGGAMKETVEHEKNGFIVPYGDKAGFALEMCKFINNPGLIPLMGKNGYDRVKTRFNRLVQTPLICDAILHSTTGIRFQVH
jgi:glycosyltransferase involved in cell wall biosynthesis